MNGWIKLHRKMLDNPVVMKDADHLAVWTYLLLNATHEDYPTLFGGKKITLKPGQLITGRQKIAREMKLNEHKVDRILKAFKSEQQIEQQSERYGRLITIVSWDEYQQSEQQTEQQVSNERATSEQRVSTIQEDKEHKNNKKNNNIRAYGEFQNVMLTDDEYTKLVEKFPRDYQERIENLSTYLKSKGRRYKDHYATILAWDRREKKKKQDKPAQEGRLDWIDAI